MTISFYLLHFGETALRDDIHKMKKIILNGHFPLGVGVGGVGVGDVQFS